MRECLRSSFFAHVCVFMHACVCAFTCLCACVKKKGRDGDEGVEQARPERYQARFRRPQKCNRVCKTRTGSSGAPWL